jgi:transcription antitermination factor NusG
MFKASGQNTEKVKDIVKTSNKEVKMTQEQLQQLNKATGIEWGEELANQLFIFSPDTPETKAQVRDVPKLDIGPYTHVAKVTKYNHMRDGRIKYHVDISDRRYLESNIFRKLKEINSELKDVLIQFTIKGSPLPTKDIKL